MKRKIGYALALVCVMAIGAVADSYTYTYTSLGNSTNLSDALPVSGWLDKIEISGDGATRTNAITIATYTGTTAVDTLATVTLTTPKVIRLRVQPTDNTGTVIPAVYAAGGTGGTNAATMLTVPYGAVLAGGNMKCNIVNDHANSNNVKVVFYYEPLKR